MKPYAAKSLTAALVAFIAMGTAMASDARPPLVEEPVSKFVCARRAARAVVRPDPAILGAQQILGERLKGRRLKAFIRGDEQAQIWAGVRKNPGRRSWVGRKTDDDIEGFVERMGALAETGAFSNDELVRLAGYTPEIKAKILDISNSGNPGLFGTRKDYFEQYSEEQKEVLALLSWIPEDRMSVEARRRVLRRSRLFSRQEQSWLMGDDYVEAYKPIRDTRELRRRLDPASGPGLAIIDQDTELSLRTRRAILEQDNLDIALDSYSDGSDFTGGERFVADPAKTREGKITNQTVIAQFTSLFEERAGGTHNTLAAALTESDRYVMSVDNTLGLGRVGISRSGRRTVTKSHQDDTVFTVLNMAGGSPVQLFSPIGIRLPEIPNFEGRVVILNGAARNRSTPIRAQAPVMHDVGDISDTIPNRGTVASFYYYPMTEAHKRRLGIE